MVKTSLCEPRKMVEGEWCQILSLGGFGASFFLNQKMGLPGKYWVASLCRFNSYYSLLTPEVIVQLSKLPVHVFVHINYGKTVVHAKFHVNLAVLLIYLS